MGQLSFCVYAIRFPRKCALQLSPEGVSVESGTQKVSVFTISKAIYLYISGLRFVSVEADLH